MSFCNTNNLEGPELVVQEQKADNKKQLILQIFKENPNRKMTWDTVFKYFKDFKELPFGKEIRETSLKRAITDLYNEGVLRKTSTTIKGTYGMCHQYYLEVVAENNQTSLF